MDYKKVLFVIAGPCVMESEELVFSSARRLMDITNKLGIHFIYKASFDKANRSKIDSFRGPGISEGLGILKNLKKKYNSIKLIVDIHLPNQAEEVAKIADILQVPAFLCRQTDLLVAAGRTGKYVNVKKGQFLSPYAIKNIIDKIETTGNSNIMITERGTFFGYNSLVNDMRSIKIIKDFNVPIVFDATHSVQNPGITTGGNRDFVETLSLAAAGAGANGFFFEVHPFPEKGLSDPDNMIDYETFEQILTKVQKIYNLFN